MVDRENQSFKCSVVVPLYNKFDRIVDTVQSILNQSLPPFEVIIVDDGSTDGSTKLISAEATQNLKIIWQPNGGVASARNTGIKAAMGDYIAFLDAGDTWEPHFLQEISQLADAYPEAALYSSAYQYVSHDQEYIDPSISLPAFFKTGVISDYFEVAAKGDLPFVMSSTCVRASTFKHVGLFTEGEPLGEDQDLFARIALECSIAHTRSVLSFCYLDDGHCSITKVVPQLECPFSLRLYYLATHEEKGVPDALRNSVLDYTASHLLKLVASNINAGRYDLAKRLLADERCKRYPMRYLWWSFRLLLAHCDLVDRRPVTY